MGRRTILLLSAMATMVFVAAGVALAANINCPGGPCLGTTAADTIRGTVGIDDIVAAQGNDSVSGREGSDIIKGDSGDDSLRGGDGPDWIFGSTGADTAAGGFGNDFINVSDNVSANDEVDCGPGIDKAVKDLGDTSTGCDGNVTVVP